MATTGETRPDNILKPWFDNLKKLQACARQVSNDVPDDLTDFAKAKPSDIFTSGDEAKGQFKQCVKTKTNINIPDSAFGKPNFQQLLEQIFVTLHGLVRSVLHDVAGNDFKNTPPADFDALPAAQVFPNDDIRGQLIAVLNQDLNPDVAGAWFPKAKADEVQKSIKTDGKKITDIVDLIATPGVSKS